MDGDEKNSIYQHSSLKETEMTIKQLDYLINNQNLNDKNMDTMNPLIPETENKVIIIGKRE